MAVKSQSYSMEHNVDIKHSNCKKKTRYNTGKRIIYNLSHIRLHTYL